MNINIESLRIIKNNELVKMQNVLKKYKFLRFVPLDKHSLSKIYSEFYIRDIGNKGGRNSGIAFAFQTHDDKVYVYGIKRHPAPHYTQYVFDKVVLLPEVKWRSEGKDYRVEKYLDDLEEYFDFRWEENEDDVHFSLWSFDMLELEYFTELGDSVFVGASKINYVIKYSMMNESNAVRSHYVFTEYGCLLFDVDEHSSRRHYTFVAAVYGFYDTDILFIDGLYQSLLSLYNEAIKSELPY